MNEKNRTHYCQRHKQHTIRLQQRWNLLTGQPGKAAPHPFCIPLPIPLPRPSPPHCRKFSPQPCLAPHPPWGAITYPGVVSFNKLIPGLRGSQAEGRGDEEWRGRGKEGRRKKDREERMEEKEKRSWKGLVGGGKLEVAHVMEVSWKFTRISFHERVT